MALYKLDNELSTLKLQLDESNQHSKALKDEANDKITQINHLKRLE